MNIKEYLAKIDLSHLKKLNFRANYSGKQSIRVGKGERIDYTAVPEQWYDDPALVVRDKDGNWVQGLKLDQISIITSVRYKD